MAVVKANYVKRGIEAKSRAKSTVRYIQNRPGKQKERLTRDLFGTDGTLDREQVYRMIDESPKGSIFYRLVISPDPNREDGPRDLNLSRLTTQTMSALEDRLKTLIQFAAVVHDDHARNRHIHVLAILNRKLTREDINFIRLSATETLALQRQILNIKQERSQGLSYILSKKPLAVGRGLRPIRASGVSADPPRRIRPACPSCSEGNGLPMRKISANLHKCSSCGIIVRNSGIGMEVEQNAGWSLGL
jgi:hypothetical protein